MIREWNTIVRKKLNNEKTRYIETTWKHHHYITKSLIQDLGLDYEVLVLLAGPKTGKTLLALTIAKTQWDLGVQFIWGSLEWKTIEASELLFQKYIDKNCYFEDDCIYLKKDGKSILKGFLKTLTELNECFGPRYEKVKTLIFDDATHKRKVLSGSVHFSITNFVEGVLAKYPGYQLFIFGRSYFNLWAFKETTINVPTGKKFYYYKSSENRGFRLLFLDVTKVLKKISRSKFVSQIKKNKR